MICSAQTPMLQGLWNKLLFLVEFLGKPKKWGLGVQCSAVPIL